MIVVLILGDIICNFKYFNMLPDKNEKPATWLLSDLFFGNNEKGGG